MKTLSFSERNGYTKPSVIIIRETLTPEIQNAICSCYDRLPKNIKIDNVIYDCRLLIEKHLWTKFLNKREADIYRGISEYHRVYGEFIQSKDNKWYEKLDMLESVIKFLDNLISQHFYTQRNWHYSSTSANFIHDLNSEFEHLNFAYRIIETNIVEISSEEEIKEIETAMRESTSIQTHLQTALKLYSQRPVGDFRNSIKESISAVEYYCREITKENTLGKALNKLTNKGVNIPETLKTAFNKLYDYTNNGETGIRHALMDETESYKPDAAEANFMLVSCCAFINYLNKKR